MDIPAPPPDTGPRRVLVDALNVAYWCGTPPSLRVPLALLTALLDAGHEARLCFDASAPYRLAADAPLYAQLVQHATLVLVAPSGRTADALLLRQARLDDACILSRDRYRDHRRRFRRLIDDPQRLLPGHVASDRVVVPALALAAALPATTTTAWQALATRLASA